MKWAVAGLVLFVLAALLLAPDGEDPAPDHPAEPAPEPDVVTPPPVVPAVVPAVAPSTGRADRSTPPDRDEPSPDPEGRLVFLLSAHSGSSFPNLDAVVVSWDGRRRGLRGPPVTEDGWIVLPRPPGFRTLEIGLPGYRRVEVDLDRLPPRSKIPLTEADAAAVGSLEFPDGEDLGDLRVEFRPLRPDTKDLPEFGVLVRHLRVGVHHWSGPLALYDLPEGDWILEVTAVVDGSVVSAKREVSVHGPSVDMGEIELEFGAGLRARVVDADGTPIPQAIVRMCREEEDETKSRTWKADDEGWVTFRDFEPGMWHRVTADGLPGPLQKLVLTPKKRGEVTSVQLEWPERLVSCVLKLDYGDWTDSWAVSLDGPVGLPKVVFNTSVGYEIHLLPGEYVWTATLIGDDQDETRKAKLVVPAAESHEAVLEFK